MYLSGCFGMEALKFPTLEILLVAIREIPKLLIALERLLLVCCFP
jgi:hypothetical protein